jgi:uncharacterized protein Yka (UPF0111/DUF47 family)
MYNVESMTPPARAFSLLISRCCDSLVSMVVELKRFKKVNKIHEEIRKINELEHDGDNLYHDSVRQLFQEEHDPLFVLKWTEMYQALEQILDACEDFANTVLGVVVKYS